MNFLTTPLERNTRCQYSIILFVDFVDNSGFRLTVTPTLRAHDAAIISVQSAVDKSQVIPPHQPNFVTTAYCNQSTLQQVRVKKWPFKTNINDGFTFKKEHEGSHLSISMLLSPDYVAVFSQLYCPLITLCYCLFIVILSPHHIMLLFCPLITLCYCLFIVILSPHHIMLLSFHRDIVPSSHYVTGFSS